MTLFLQSSLAKSIIIIVALLFAGAIGCTKPKLDESEFNNSDNSYDQIDWCLTWDSCDVPSCSSHPSCQVCGDGVMFQPDLYYNYEWLESCDGTDLGMNTCQNTVPDSSGGALLCDENCNLITDYCLICGNGVIEGTETCDNSQLSGDCSAVWEYDTPAECDSQCQIDYRGCHLNLPLTSKNIWYFVSDHEGETYFIEYRYYDEPVMGVCGLSNCTSIHVRNLNSDLNSGWTLQLSQENEYIYIYHFDRVSDGTFYAIGKTTQYDNSQETTMGLILHITRDGTLLWRYEDTDYSGYELAYQGASGLYYVVPEMPSIVSKKFQVISQDGTLLHTVYMGYGKKILDIKEIGANLQVTFAALDITTNTYGYFINTYDNDMMLTNTVLAGPMLNLPTKILKIKTGEIIIYSSSFNSNDVTCYLSIITGANWCKELQPVHSNKQFFFIDEAKNLYCFNDKELQQFNPSGQLIFYRDYSTVLTDYSFSGIVHDRNDKFIVPANRIDDYSKTLLIMPAY